MSWMKSSKKDTKEGVKILTMTIENREEILLKPIPCFFPWSVRRLAWYKIIVISLT